MEVDEQGEVAARRSQVGDDLGAVDRGKGLDGLELDLGLALGRTSCSRFVSNQLRVLLTATAYVLFQELRRAARGTALATAQVPTLRGGC